MILYLLRIFFKGLLLSAGVSLLLFTGMTITCKYLPGSVLFPAVLIIICSLLLWIGVRFDRMLDQADTVASTVAFDFKYTHTGFITLLRLFRPLIPYMIIPVTILMVHLIFVAIPSVIVYLITGPEQPVIALPYSVFIVNTGICVLYFSKNQDEFSSIIEKAAFFAGVAPGQAGIVAILTSYFFL